MNLSCTVYPLGLALITVFVLTVFVFHWDAALTAVGLLSGVLVVYGYQYARSRLRRER